MNLNEADQVVHPIENEWHYPTMVRYGFVPITLTQKGFVRRYEYRREGMVFVCRTGVNSDYWEGAGGFGYWQDLEPFMEKLA